jgi:hypothetical protein
MFCPTHLRELDRAPMAVKPGPHVDDVELLRNHAGDGG